MHWSQKITSTPRDLLGTGCMVLSDPPAPSQGGGEEIEVQWR